MPKVFKTKQSRSKRSQPAGDTSRRASSAGASTAGPASTSPTTPQIDSPSLGGSEPILSLTNAPVVNPPSGFAPIPNTSGGRKPFVRLARDRKDDELKILVCSYIMSDLPSLRLAVQVSSRLAELVQASFLWLSICSTRQFANHASRYHAQRQMNFVKSPKRRPSLSILWSMSPGGTQPSCRTS